MVFLLAMFLSNVMPTSGNLTKVIAKLGWKRILVVPQNSMLKSEVIPLARNGIHVSSMDSACDTGTRFLQSLDGLVIDMRYFNETLLLQIILCRRPEPFRAIVMVTRVTLDLVQATLRRKNITIGLNGLIMPEYELVRIIKMKFSTETVLMPYKFMAYDFQNLTFECYNLPWHPSIDYDCKGSVCRVSGLYPRILSHLGKWYNFSVAYHLDPSGKWGSPSKLGENDSSVLKTLQRGNSAFSFSWVGTYDRVMKFDHLQGITLKKEMYMMQSGPKVSMDMVFQPFSTMVWAYIAAFVALVALVNKVLKRSKSLVGEPARFKYGLALLLGFFMTVVISFYRSAMILALTARQPPPFETILDGLADQDWSLVYLKGTEGLFKSYYKLVPKEQGRQDQVLHHDYNYKSNNRGGMFQHLTDPKTFLVEDEVRAANFLRKTDCQRCKDAFRFGRPETKNSGFLFEKHSPLRAVFKEGLVHMQETGTIDRIKRSLGPEYIPVPYQSALPLTIQLLVLLFMFLGWVAIVMCPILLAVECLWRWLCPRLMSKGTKEQLYTCERIYEEKVCENCGRKQIRQTICVN